MADMQTHMARNTEYTAQNAEYTARGRNTENVGWPGVLGIERYIER